MSIDWGQIVTHIIGFLITLWLLRRYAWDKILGFVEGRRDTIANSFDEIEKGKAEVVAQKEHYDKELENIEGKRREIIQVAAKEAEELANEIKDEARKDAVATRDKAKKDVEIELDKANEILKDRMIDAVFTTTEKMIKERLDRETHAKLVDDFLNQLKMN
jgi:F-type H+-transporting ATPase subunit b